MNKLHIEMIEQDKYSSDHTNHRPVSMVSEPRYLSMICVATGGLVTALIPKHTNHGCVHGIWGQLLSIVVDSYTMNDH